MLARVQEDASAAQEDECRSAEVRDPAGEKDAGGRAAGGHTGKDPHVINGHQDHHGSANQIDGPDPRVHGRLDCYWAGCHAHAHSLLRSQNAWEALQLELPWFDACDQ